MGLTKRILKKKKFSRLFLENIRQAGSGRSPAETNSFYFFGGTPDPDPDCEDEADHGDAEGSKCARDRGEGRRGRDEEGARPRTGDKLDTESGLAPLVFRAPTGERQQQVYQANGEGM